MHTCAFQLKGGGAARQVSLHPQCVFAMDMAQLVAFHPEGLLISKVIPEYKEKFGKDLVVSDIGFSKLIRALESIPTVLEVSIIIILTQCTMSCNFSNVYWCNNLDMACIHRLYIHDYVHHYLISDTDQW